VKTNQPTPEGKVQGEGEQGEIIDDVSALSALTHSHLNKVAFSPVPRMIRSLPEKIRANSEIILPPMRQHLIALPPPSSTAQTIKTSGNGYCKFEAQIPYSVTCIPALHLYMYPNHYHAILGTGIPTYLP
jgi:hypothetical protein